MSVPIIGPDGRRYSIEQTELPEAIRQGYRPETPETPQTTGEAATELGHEALQTAGAAVEGAVEGFAPGLLGAVTGGTPEAKEILQRREESPIAHGLGEFAGLIASPINKLAPVVEGARAATVAGRIGQRALSGAVTGSLFGAGSTVSDVMLGDAELTADKVLLGAGMGALLGGAGGGIFGGLEEGARAALPKLAGAVGDAQKTLDGIANDATVAAMRNTNSELSKFTPAQLQKVAGVVRERGHLKLSPEDIAKSVAADVADTGAKKGAFLDRAAGTPDWQAAMARLDQHLADLPPLERETAQKWVAEARTGLEDLATKPKDAGWREFDKWKQGLQEKAKFSRGAVEDDMGLRMKRELAGVAREELDRQLVPALGKEGKAFLATKDLYGTLRDAERLASKGSTRPGGFSLTDLGIGNAVHHPAGVITAVASKFMREHGAALVAKAADAISKSPALEAVAKSMGAQLGNLTPKLGPYGAPLMNAFALTPATGLATHMLMAQVDPSYAATAATVGLMPEGPEEHSAALERAHGLATIHGSVQHGDETLDKHLGRVLKGSGEPPSAGAVMKRQDFGAMRMRRGPEASHEKRVEEIRQLATDPAALLERLSGNLEKLGPVAPGLSAALSARANVAVQYLAQAAEVPPKPGPLAREWTATQAERHVFAQKLEVVEDPMSVMRHAAAGTLTEPQMEALRAVYPTLAKTIGDRALEQAMGAKHIPYRSRMMLTLLTGVDVDGSLSQQAIAANQTAIRGTKSEADEANAPPKSGARDTEMTLAQRMANPQDKREMEPSE